MSEVLNNTCAICGKKYKECNTCKKIKTYKAWRTIADTEECFKIYSVLYDYNRGTIDKSKAKELLKSCRMPETFQSHIKKVIDEIMCEKPTVKSSKGLNNMSKTKK